MSKDTPEVGDVWVYKRNEFEIRYYISAIAGQKCSEYYLYVLYVNGNNFVVGCWLDEKEWEQQVRCGLTYISKSKANIDDLFKTENEE